MTPFTGEHTRNPHCYSFNFYLSQLRICIEMAFGRLSGKCTILQKKLKQSLPKASKIINCCAILHNYIINEDCTDIGDMTEIPDEEHCITPRGNAPFNMSYLKRANWRLEMFRGVCVGLEVFTGVCSDECKHTCFR